MVRSSTSMKRQRQPEESKEQNPQVAERKRLKKLAFTNNVLCETPAKCCRLLNPSKTVLKHRGRDIVKKSQRKNRFLFAFPGLMAPIGGGRIGELKDLGTKNPILYIDFPQGRMKLFGTIVYPKNRYLTMQFSKGGKNVMCEDNFDNVIVFSDAWWIGMKDENPEEVRLDFPVALTEGQQVEYDFKGGAGATSRVDPIPMTSTKCESEQIRKTETDDYSFDVENNHKNMQVMPVRHSERTARKTYKFAENSSGDDSVKSSPEMHEHDDVEVREVHTPKGHRGNDTKANLHSSTVDIKDKDDTTRTPIVKPDKESASLATTKKLSDSISESAAKEAIRNNHGSLVQATISTLFKKVEEKRTLSYSKKSSSTKVSSPTLQKVGSKRNINEEGRCRKKAKHMEGKNSGQNNKAKTEALEDEDDDIEEFSSSSKDTGGSDEDWVA